MRIFAAEGKPFLGLNSYEGYNEVVVQSDPWIDGLPKSVEAIFFIAQTSVLCRSGKTQLGQAYSCQDAEARARRVHAAMLQHYGLAPESPGAPALLEFTPEDFVSPFRAVLHS